MSSVGENVEKGFLHLAEWNAKWCSLLGKQSHS
jgi:hypothetical protein